MKKRYIFLIVILILIGVPMLNFYRIKQEIIEKYMEKAKEQVCKALQEELASI